MADRTQLSQQDEALRQARATSLRAHRTRTGLQWIAQRLDSHRPGFTMTTTDRDGTAREYVLTAYRNDRDANTALWDLTEALPPVRTGDTRAEYAARVRLLVQEVSA